MQTGATEQHSLRDTANRPDLISNHASILAVSQMTGNHHGHRDKALEITNKNGGNYVAVNRGSCRLPCPRETDQGQDLAWRVQAHHANNKKIRGVLLKRLSLQNSSGQGGITDLTTGTAEAGDSRRTFRSRANDKITQDFEIVLVHSPSRCPRETSHNGTNTGARGPTLIHDHNMGDDEQTPPMRSGRGYRIG